MNELFKNTHEALRFAFNFSSQQYPESQMAKLIKQNIGTGKGLVAIDGASQAGLILAELSKMDRLHFHCLVARHAMRYKECSCCGGEKRMQAWHESIVALRDWSMSTFTGLSHSKTREAIIMKYFGEKIDIKTLAARMGVSAKTIYDQRAKIVGALKKLDDAAQNDMHERLASKEDLIEIA
jgi:hypothetical protein